MSHFRYRRSCHKALDNTGDFLVVCIRRMDILGAGSIDWAHLLRWPQMQARTIILSRLKSALKQRTRTRAFTCCVSGVGEGRGVFKHELMM